MKIIHTIDVGSYFQFAALARPGRISSLDTLLSNFLSTTEQNKFNVLGFFRSNNDVEAAY